MSVVVLVSVAADYPIRTGCLWSFARTKIRANTDGGLGMFFLIFREIFISPVN